MRVAICDDERYWRENLKGYIHEYEKKNNIQILTEYFSNGYLLLQSAADFDVIFMDYQMEDLNGIETARKIRNHNKNCIIIFVSAYPDVALDTFEVDAFRFLTKPINREKLFKSLDDYMKTEKEQFLIFRIHNGSVKLKESDIIYCESVQRRTVIYTADKSYEVLLNIREVEKMLPAEKFMRCHKCFIISFYHVRSYDYNEITLDRNYKAYIGRKYQQHFQQEIEGYTLKYNMGKI